MTKDIETTISYWRDPGDGSLPDPEHDKAILLGHHDEIILPVFVKDIRGTESSYALDTHGFQVHTLPKKDRDAKIEEADDSEYFEELSRMVKLITGAKDVIIFAKIIRQKRRDELLPHEFVPGQVQGPSPRPHVDFAPENAEAAVRMMVPGGGDLVDTATRWQILGIWRPTKFVQRDPLILADARSVPDSDFRDLDRTKNRGAGMKMVNTVIANGNEEKHRWHYLSDMTPEEVLIFKHFDTKKDIPAWRCAHTSMNIPGTEHLPPRESFEVRALVAY